MVAVPRQDEIARPYITASTALAISGGDWHPPAPDPGRWEVAGINYEGAEFLGDWGLYDCAPALRNMGIPARKPVLCAGNARAFVNMVWNNLKRGRTRAHRCDRAALREANQAVSGMLGMRGVDTARPPAVPIRSGQPQVEAGGGTSG